jgi:cytochrome c553
MSQPFLHAVIAAVLALAANSAAAQATPKPPADKAPDTSGASDKPHASIESFHAQCIGCHGIPGYKTAYPVVYHVPMIAGQQAGYIVAALKEYKSGARSHPSMRGIAASLTEEQMQKLAEYYSHPAR